MADPKPLSAEHQYSPERFLNATKLNVFPVPIDLPSLNHEIFGVGLPMAPQWKEASSPSWTDWLAGRLWKYDRTAKVKEKMLGLQHFKVWNLSLVELLSICPKRLSHETSYHEVNQSIATPLGCKSIPGAGKPPPPLPLRFRWQFTCTRLCSRGKDTTRVKDSSQQHDKITQPGHTLTSCLRAQHANRSATASLKVREQARCITLQDAGWLKPRIRKILTLHIQKSTSIDSDTQSILCMAPISSRQSSPCCFKPQCAPVTNCHSIFDPCYVRKRMAIYIAVEFRCSFLKHCLISRFCHEKR